MMKANFDCDLNTKRGRDECQPEWKISRLDAISSFSTGYNYYEIDRSWSHQRTVTKRYGIRLELNAEGKVIASCMSATPWGFHDVCVCAIQAGVFSIEYLLIAVGSGIAFFTVASLITDTFLQVIQYYS